MQNFFETETSGMGTIISQSVFGENAEKAVLAVVNELKRLEAMMSFFIDSSEVSKLNAASGISSVQLSSEVLYILKKSRQFSELSHGAFDITSAPLIKLWGIFTPHETVPPEDRIRDVLHLINYKDILVDESSNSAMLLKKGQMVDLGGIAKGFAADRAAEIYKEMEISSAFINLGGNVLVLGSRPDGSPWNIGLQDPFAERGKCIGIVQTSEKSVVTSGDYVRFFEKGNTRYHHILDPKTGYPARSGVISATVICENSIEADALSTALLVLGAEKGMELISTANSAEAIIITEDRKVYLSRGAYGIFAAFDEKNGFEYL